LKMMQSPQRKNTETTSARISADALVCHTATLDGDITIGARTVVHPKATIIAKDGPIVIGEGNLIEEQTIIVNKNPPGVDEVSPLVIGDYNVFEVASEFRGKTVGNNNVLEVKAKVGPNTQLTNGCVIGNACSVNSVETLQENTVVYGESCTRRKMLEKPPPQTQQLDFLRKILPNYQHFIITKKT